MTERDAFGPGLRRERERRGVTLEAIAQSTKVKASLLAALERNDVSRWPAGIFRRSFFKGYTSSVGLPGDALLIDFLRLFPEPGAPAVPSSDEGLRLTLEPDTGWKVRERVRRALAALADTGAIVLTTVAIERLTGRSPWMIGAAIGLAYYAMSTVCLGQSAAAWLLERRWSPRWRQPVSVPTIREKRHSPVLTVLDVSAPDAESGYSQIASQVS